MTDAIEGLLEEILVDANGDDEQLTAFQQAFDTSVRFPFPARVVGVPVEVTGVLYERDARRGLVAICRREGQPHRVTLVDLTPGPVKVETSMLLEAYRRWSGLPPGTAEPSPSSTRSWDYRPLANSKIMLTSPLVLRAHGRWDPADEYWGEPYEERHPLVSQIIAVGPRPAFEMEQVIPGVDADDWDSDPVADGAASGRLGSTSDSDPGRPHRPG